MKKIVKCLSIILLMSIFMINVKGVSSFSNYNDAIKNTDDYIIKFTRYKLFIDSNNKYLYDGVTLNKSSDFNNGGFINNYEFNTSFDKNNDSYLITGSKYWTMTKLNNSVYAVDIRKISNVSISHSYESRITELIIPETMVSGSGSRDNPWMFITPEFKITINLVNASINDKNKISETVIGYNKTYTITPDKSYYIFKNKEGDLVCDKTIGSYKIVDNKLVLDNIKGNGSCSIRYRGKDVTANIVVNNGTAANSILTGEVGDSLSTTVNGTSAYAYDSVSCTNGQSASYVPKKITVNNITNDTTCTVIYGKPEDKIYTFVANDQTYNVKYNGYYTFELLGAQGEYGGKGAKVNGTVYLSKGDTIIVNTGGAGSNSGTAKGYNGGGSGQYYGGGASTIKKNGTILIAAAGGGGGKNGTAGGTGNAQGGASVGDKAGSKGTNGGGGGSSYDYYYDDNCKPCYTGADTCTGGYILTNCKDCHHTESKCHGGYVPYRYGDGTGDRWYECRNNGWYGYGSSNINCGTDQKVFSCSPPPTGSCTNGSKITVSGACTGYCIGEQWKDCAYTSDECVYGCDSVWSECAEGENTCKYGCDRLKKDYISGNGGSNKYSSNIKNITINNGYNTGNGQVKVTFYGEEL